MQKTISLTVLDNVEIATPCTASWEEMIGNDQTRYCTHCSLNVYNLSGMTREDATNLISGAEGRVCIRLYRRTDGTVLTQDCPTGLRAARERVSRSIRNIAATVATLFAGLLGLGARQASAQDDASPHMMMGGMVAPHRTEPEKSAPKHEKVKVKKDTVVADNSRRLIMGEMAIYEPEPELVEATIEPVAVRPVEIQPALVEARVIEPVSPRPLNVEPIEVEPIGTEPVQSEPVQSEPVYVEPVLTGINEPKLSYVMMGQMMIDESEPVNPVDVPPCDPEVPIVDAITGPEIK